MIEKKEDELKRTLEEKKRKMNTLLDSGDRTEYIPVESEIYELKKLVGEPLSNW